MCGKLRGKREVSLGEESSKGGCITVNFKVNTSNGANVLNFLIWGVRVRVHILWPYLRWVYCVVSGGCISENDEENLYQIAWFTMISIYVY